ncbi:hypothetical protein HDU90_008955 [Geranomyces variabilis]|nr:hypothetical protein HDU90_008955 [Geranomyces variabilis]
MAMRTVHMTEIVSAMSGVVTSPPGRALIERLSAFPAPSANNSLVRTLFPSEPQANAIDVANMATSSPQALPQPNFSLHDTVLPSALPPPPLPPPPPPSSVPVLELELKKKLVSIVEAWDEYSIGLLIPNGRGSRYPSIKHMDALKVPKWRSSQNQQWRFHDRRAIWVWIKHQARLTGQDGRQIASKLENERMHGAELNASGKMLGVTAFTEKLKLRSKAANIWDTD